MAAGIAAFRRQWEGHVVDGFRLQQYLGGGDGSAVFRTQFRGQLAAVKLVAADPGADLQLSRWRIASKLSHPHLIRLFHLGRWQLDDTSLLYAVMEYAEEDLSQVLPSRPLTAVEAREMLGPALSALQYLHHEGFVHGHLKPANIMAVGDRLRISSDGLCRMGEPGLPRAKPGVHDPPEMGTTGISKAGDVWSLGVVLVEALTQQGPEPVLPEALPDPFREIARHCLQSDPRNRWTVAEIAAHLRQSGPVAGDWTVVQRPSRFLKLRYIAPAAALVLGALALVLERKAPGSPGNVGAAPAVQIEPVKAQKPAAAVVHQVVPEVPPKVRSTIRGKVTVRVKVSVDASGGVTDVKLDSPGASRYFARLAMQAARQWKFSPDAGQEWTLRFEFGKNGTNVYPARRSAVR